MTKPLGACLMLAGSKMYCLFCPLPVGGKSEDEIRQHMIERHHYQYLESLTDEEAKARIVADQFPKKCSCGRTFSREEWAILDFVSSYTDNFATFELRNCFCGSTLMVVTEVHDLNEE